MVGIHNISLKKIEEKSFSLITILASKITLRFVIAVGIILRVSQYLYNRSLTEGEAALAINIVRRSYAELFKPLDYVQAAPAGFLVLQKFSINVFGNNEFALRLFPLVFAVMAMFLFFAVAKKSLCREAIPVALILFTVGDQLIYFASENKQYSSDVAITLVIILMAIYILNSNLDIKRILLWGSISAIFFWFSHPAVFTFYATALVIILSSIRNKQRKVLFWVFVAGAVATTSLGINYFISLEALSRNKDFIAAWQHSFTPLPPISFNDIRQLGFLLLRVFKSPVGLSIYELLLAVLSFTFGCFVMFYKRKKVFLILLLPTIFTLLASGFQKYPFEGRLLLFITPSMILIIAEGIDFIRRKSARASNTVGVALVGILLFHPVVLAGYRLIKPRAPEELRPVIVYLKENQKEDDVIYLYYAAVNAFRYYSDKFNYCEDDYIIGIASQYDWTKYYEDLKKLKGNSRVWLLFSHIVTWHGVDEEKLFISYLNILGTQLDAFRTSGASAYLYDLTQPSLRYSP